MVVPKAGPRPLSDLAEFLEPFGKLVVRPESREALERYTTGLLSDVSRKTASEIGRSLPSTNGQRLQELLTRTSWEFQQMDRQRIAHMLERASVGKGVVIVDDTGLAKKGRHSVGVGRQYSGTLGRVDNCQVVVTTHYVDAVFDWPVNARVYLPKDWSKDRPRCTEAHVPREVPFRTKGQIGLHLIDEAREAGISPRAVVADAGYGDQPTFLDGLETRQLAYVVGVSVSARFRLAEQVEADPGDVPAPAYSGRGRPPKAPSLEQRVESMEASAILEALPDDAWSQVAWREGTQGPLVKAAVRVRVYRTGQRAKHIPTAGWLVGERPLEGHEGDRKFYFVCGLDKEDLQELMGLAHVRWVIERFYQDGKGELGLDDYEGRLWPGLHRHLALVMLAHCYLTLRQSYGPQESLQRSPPAAGGDPASCPAPSAAAFPP